MEGMGAQKGFVLAERRERRERRDMKGASWVSRRVGA